MLLLLHRIAYFYEVSSKRPTHYRWFFVPMLLLLAGGLRYAMLSHVAGDVLGDTFLMLGGFGSLSLGMFLLREMTGGRR